MNGLRWSSVRTCPRKAAYEGLGYTGRPRTITERRTLFRGKSLGRDFVIFLAAERKELGKPWRVYVASGRKDFWPEQWLTLEKDDAAFVVEEAVPWSLGVLHPDVRVVETDTLIEVLSSAHASDAMRQSKLLQLTGQMEHTGAKSGALAVVNPASMDYELYPVARTSPRYKELVKEMHERIAAVQAWKDTGDLPERVCAKPSEARGRFCLFADSESAGDKEGVCFQDWVAPELPDVEDAETRELVGALYRAKQHEKEARTLTASYETARKEIEQRLDDLIPVGKHRVGSLEIARSHVRRGPSFNVKKAELAGFHVPDEFLKAGASYDTFRVERTSDAPVEDFGTEAPWTDEDLEGRAA